MLRSLACALALSATALPVAAESLEISTTVAFESKYLFRGVEFAGTSFQPAVNLSYGNLYLNAWLNLPIGDNDGPPFEPFGDELDLIGGYSFPLSEVVSVDLGFTYYMFPDATSGFFDVWNEDKGDTGGNTFEPFVGISLDIPLSPSVYVYHDIFLDTTTVQGNASYSFPLSEKASFDLGGYLGYVIDDAGGTDYLYGTASANLSYALSESGSFYGGVRYGGSDIAGGSVIDDYVAGTTKSSGFWFGVGFTSSF
jgi:hypothetical protein